MKYWYVAAIAILVVRLLTFSRSVENILDPPFIVETVLKQEPKLGPASQRISLSGYDIVLPRYPELNYGDKIKIFVEKLSCNQSNPSTAKIFPERCSAIFPKVEILDENQGNWFLARVAILRRQILDNFKKFLPEPEVGLVGGVVLGDKNGLGPELKDQLRVAGLSHVAVASGMNIAFITAFLAKFIKRKKWLMVIFVWIYSLLAGFESPVVRAAIMASLTILAEMTGRKSGGLWALVITGWLMLMIDPALAGDIGFQLSIAATAGVISLPKIETLGALIMTLPITINAFGTFSLIALPANVLLLWLIGPLTIAGMLMALSGGLLAAPVYALAHCFVWGVEIIGTQKFWLLQNIQVVPIVWVGYYLIILALWQKLKSR